MSAVGIIKLTAPGAIPADAPPPHWGECGWMPGSRFPVQIGVYRRLTMAGTTMYSFFDGGHWLWNQPSPDLAVRVPSTEPSLVQMLPWCGLNVPPPMGYGPLPTHRTELPT